MSALVAELEAMEVEDMEVGLDYWLPGDVKLQQMQLQQTRERVLTPCLYCPDSNLAARWRMLADFD